MIVLYDFQKPAVKKALCHRGFGLFMPTGTGKTIVSLTIADTRNLRGQVSRVLLVVPKGLIEQWREAIAAWLPRATILDDPLGDDPGGGLCFYVTHYEAAREAQRTLRKHPFDMMICDECHKLKGRGSRQSRRLAMIGYTCMYRLGLTGTPVEGNELDFWAQMRFIDPEVFGRSWTEFARGWTRPSGFMGKKPVLKASLKEKFLSMIERVSFMISKEDALDLPPVVEQVIPVRMTPKQNKVYRQMEEHLVAELPTGEVIASQLVVTQLIRLQQMTGGFAPSPDGTLVPIGNAKLDALADLVDGHPDPMVIYCRFLEEIRQVKERLSRLGRRVNSITGEYQDDHKRFDILLCQVSVVAGLDGIQHRASTCCFYSKTFSSIHYEQALSRLYREGQKKTTTIYHLNCVSSIDQDLLTALHNKRDTIATVVHHLQARHTMAAKAKKSDNVTQLKKKVATKVARATGETPATDVKEGYGIGYLAEQLGVEPAGVRVRLRRLNVEKNEGRYQWNKKSEADAVVKQLSSVKRGAPGKKSEAAA